MFKNKCGDFILSNYYFLRPGLWNSKKRVISCSLLRKCAHCKWSQTKHLNPIYVPEAPAAPPLAKTPYVSVDQLEKFSVTMVYDYMRISLREGLQEG